MASSPKTDETAHTPITADEPSFPGVELSFPGIDTSNTTNTSEQNKKETKRKKVDCYLVSQLTVHNYRRTKRPLPFQAFM
jgi:hypothetical protein